ncbi:Eukaryotic membrane protein family [Phytophthora infestans]|uniref:Eukaryotic membrane protein family n=1 Tax=Phytophthora infestans TaxID=4787 RepID=A0A8S9UF36_PHYIN|nr:Eukaryotic membrane protein family [Phytophthora infestans]KAF4149606.1 Eukaryotic membrane protein family [Phytophthora infestans]
MALPASLPSITNHDTARNKPRLDVSATLFQRKRVSRRKTPRPACVSSSSVKRRKSSPEPPIYATRPQGAAKYHAFTPLLDATATKPSPMLNGRYKPNLEIETDFSADNSPTSFSPVAPLARSSPYPSTARAADTEPKLTQTSSPRAMVAAIPAMPPAPHPFRLSDFFYKEIFGVHDIKQSDGVHQERVQNFFVVPLNTEQLFLFGVLLALDSFLYVFTYLPLRILFACGCAVTSSFHARVFRRTHFYDLMVAVIIAVGTTVLGYVDMSRVYHAIRGQAMIKLYVLFTMIEIFDRLFSSLGQDVLDSLYYTAKYHPRRVTRMFLDFAVAITYVVLHALLLFAQVVTLNVAVNSSNTSLLTLLISNNFAELKSSVFKKFEEQNLFQISCSDIVERFKLLTIIGLILLQSSTGDVAWGTAMVWVAEMVIDWLKHAFITKFNQLPPTMYSKFITILCRDLTGWKSEDTILDHTHHVSKRLGLMSLPLACVVLRMVSKALVEAPIELASPGGILVTVAFFLCLAAFKALLSLVLMIYACKSGRLDDTRPKSPRSVSHLESIHRYKF